MLEFRSCVDVAVNGLTFVNSPWWTLHPFNCSGFRCHQSTVTSAGSGLQSHEAGEFL
jgi:polygalacturonase